MACRQIVPPGLVFPTIDTEGHLCTSSYCPLGIQQQAVGSAEAEVFVIKRAVHTSTGVSTIWHSSFLPSGYGWESGRGQPQPCGDPGEGVTSSSPCRRLARLEQVGCPMLVLLQDESVLGKTGTEGGGFCPPAWAAPARCLAAKWGTPCPAFLLPDGVEPQPPFPKQPLDWEEDIQLWSWFMDRKEELQASHAAYVQQHPELRALLSDFLQALLLQQPCDPISFAAQFFAHQQRPRTPFTSTGAASPSPP
uniref:Ciliogenesis-associated TTC17-interacting protein n=1 Tax=Falco tinnunculus TaxID=100819 RepID=A0A8C4XSA6_FALTI